MYTYVCVYICMYVCMYIFICIYRYTYMYICTYACIRINICTYIYICIHTFANRLGSHPACGNGTVQYKRRSVPFCANQVRESKKTLFPTNKNARHVALRFASSSANLLQYVFNLPTPNSFVCGYVWMYVCMHICRYLYGKCICIYIYIYMYMYIYIDIYIQIRMYVYVRLYVFFSILLPLDDGGSEICPHSAPEVLHGHRRRLYSLDPHRRGTRLACMHIIHVCVCVCVSMCVYVCVWVCV